MGQILPTPSSEDQKMDEDIAKIIKEHYEKDFKTSEGRKIKTEKFCKAVPKIFDEIKGHIGSTQFIMPDEATIKNVFEEYTKAHPKKEEADPEMEIPEEDLKKLLKEVILKTKFKGAAAYDVLLYIFGAPVTALLIKQRVAPTLVSNDYMVPAVTAATVFLLALLKKI